MATTTSNPIDFAALALGPVTEGGVGLRGPLGLGKSAVVAAVAERTGKRMLDIRLSLFTEDDIIKHVGTSFAPPDWLHTACAEPCVLFFAEAERADHNTQRAVAQLVRGRELRGWRLHPGTRVFVAVVNHSPELLGALGVVYDLVPPLPCNPTGVVV